MGLNLGAAILRGLTERESEGEKAIAAPCIFPHSQTNRERESICVFV